MVKLFISSVQREFETERREVAAYIRQDAVMGRFFEPFLFEELPAKDVSAQQAYLTEVAETKVYLGLFGVDYGYEDTEGISPTEREYDCATENHKYRIVLSPLFLFWPSGSNWIQKGRYFIGRCA